MKSLLDAVENSGGWFEVRFRKAMASYPSYVAGDHHSLYNLKSVDIINNNQTTTFYLTE